VGDLILLPAVFAVHVAALVTPGPNVLVVTRTAASGRRATAVLVALGVATGAAIWATAAALGVQALFESVGLSPRLLQLAGGAYLMWLGLRLWTSSLSRHGVPHPPALSHTSRISPYLVGLFTNLSNPKSLIFFGSVFASILGPHPSATLRVAGVLLIVFDATIWHVGLALLFSTGAIQSRYDRIRSGLDRAVGSVFITIGLGLMGAAV
jgi:threonine efflux protein